MVEGQGQVDPLRIDHPGPPGVVAALWNSPGLGDEHGRNGVQARVAVRVGIGVKLAEKVDFEAGLFPGLPDGGRLERFAVVDEPAGEGPAGRRIPPFNEDDPPPSARGPDFDYDVHCRDRVPVAGPGRLLRHAKAILGGIPPSVNQALPRTDVLAR